MDSLEVLDLLDWTPPALVWFDWAWTHSLEPLRGESLSGFSRITRKKGSSSGPSPAFEGAAPSQPGRHPSPHGVFVSGAESGPAVSLLLWYVRLSERGLL